MLNHFRFAERSRLNPRWSCLLSRMVFLMGHWDDSNLINARVSCERFLQLERRNVFTTANDDLFLRFSCDIAEQLNSSKMIRYREESCLDFRR